MSGLFIERLLDNPWFFFSWSLIIVFSICVHEYAHARASVARGDTAAAGHLTLNPFVQMGPISLVALLVMGFAWGAVPVRGDALWRRSDRAWVAAVGPLANLALCAAFSALTAVAVRLLGSASPAASFLLLATQANGILFMLNLLPAPMLDGWSVFALFLPIMDEWRRRYGTTLSWVVLFLLLATPIADLVWSAGAGMAGLFIRLSIRILRV